MLGVATAREAGAGLGRTVRVTVSDPAGVAHQARFRVTGRASLNAGTGGLGSGAVMTIRSFVSAQCPPGPRQSACQRAVRGGIPYVVLVSSAPGRPGGRRWPGISIGTAASCPTGQASLADQLR